MNKIHLLEMLTNNAREYRMTANESVKRNSHMNSSTGTAIDQKDVDAMLTDFVNFVANKQGVDYGLYATDLADEKLMVATAAVRHKEGRIWTLPRPYRHDDVVSKARREGVTYNELEKGFLLSNGSFVNRETAEIVARESGQKTGALLHPLLGGLSSDDLW